MGVFVVYVALTAWHTTSACILLVISPMFYQKIYFSIIVFLCLHLAAYTQKLMIFQERLITSSLSNNWMKNIIYIQ